MLCAVIFVAWFGGLGPALLAIALALLAFHYYLVPPINSFTWKNDVFAVAVPEVPRLILFSIASLVVAFVISAQRRATEFSGVPAMNCERRLRIKGGLKPHCCAAKCI